MPFSFAPFLPITPNLFLSSFFFAARFASSSFFARLSRAGFSKSIWRPLTRVLYMPTGSEDSDKFDATYVGVNGFALVNRSFSD